MLMLLCNLSCFCCPKQASTPVGAKYAFACKCMLLYLHRRLDIPRGVDACNAARAAAHKSARAAFRPACAWRRPTLGPTFRLTLLMGQLCRPVTGSKEEEEEGRRTISILLLPPCPTCPHSAPYQAHPPSIPLGAELCSASDPAYHVGH
jgi:hypothetical protein